METTFPSAPLIRPASTHKLHVRKTCCSMQIRNFASNYSSCSCVPIRWLLLFFVSHRAIGMFNFFIICLLCNVTTSLVGYRWITLSISCYLSFDKMEFSLDMRRFQSLIVGVAFLRFMSNCQNAIWRGCVPCWRKMVDIVTTVSNLHHRALLRDVPTYSIGCELHQLPSYQLMTLKEKFNLFTSLLLKMQDFLDFEMMPHVW